MLGVPYDRGNRIGVRIHILKRTHTKNEKERHSFYESFMNFHCELVEAAKKMITESWGVPCPEKKAKRPPLHARPRPNGYPLSTGWVPVGTATRLVSRRVSTGIGLLNGAKSSAKSILGFRHQKSASFDHSRVGCVETRDVSACI